MELDPWQAHVLRNSLAQQDDGLWSAFLVGVVVSRQNGKGSILEARELAGLFLPDLDESLILHSAHEFKTCYEHFLRITQLIEGCPDLDRHVQKIRRGVGEQAVELKNGNRLRFIARSSGSGRGMSAPCVVLDEAMFLTEAQIGAIMPTLSAQPNPQLWFTSSAPLASSYALHRLRGSAITGDDARLFYAEWGNDEDADPTDLDAIARANPALGRRIHLDFIETERSAMSPAEFARERLGVPEHPNTAASAINPALWADLAETASKAETHHSWALSVSPDRKWASIGIAGRRADGHIHVEWQHHEPGTAWIVEACQAMYRKRRIPLRIAANSAEASLIEDIVEAGVEVVEVSTTDVARATGEFIDAANNYRLRHLGQRSLDKAVGAAVLKTTEAGASVWAERSSDIEITPLKAVTVALGGVTEQKDRSAVNNVW